MRKYFNTVSSAAELERDIPTSKVATQLASLKADSNVIPVVFVAPGSISPVHKMHVQMLEAAKEHLEKDGKMKVVGGYLSPSHDSYVSRKLKKDTINFEHRLGMCNLALADSNWIDVSQWEGRQSHFSYWDIVMHVHKTHLESKFPTYKKLVLMFVCGADLAVKSGGMMEGVCGFPVVVVGRKGDTEILLESSKRHHKYIPPTNFYFASKDLQEVSSTEIRKRLKHGGDLEALMHPAAAAYLREHVRYEHEVPAEPITEKSL